MHGKEKRLAFGIYPDVPLKLARERREKARRLLAEDIDPGERKKELNDAKLEEEDRVIILEEAVRPLWVNLSPGVMPC